MSFKIDQHGIMHDLSRVHNKNKSSTAAATRGGVWIQFVVYNCSRMMISDLVLASYRSCRDNDNNYQVPVNIGFRLFMIIWGILERERERERESGGSKDLHECCGTG